MFREVQKKFGGNANNVGMNGKLAFAQELKEIPVAPNVQKAKGVRHEKIQICKQKVLLQTLYYSKNGVLLIKKVLKIMLMVAMNMYYGCVIFVVMNGVPKLPIELLGEEVAHVVQIKKLYLGKMI